MTTLCPDEAAACQRWYSNDGDGLDAAGAAALAVKLQALQNSGAVEAYYTRREAAMLPKFFDDVGTVEPSEKAPNGVDQFIAFLKASGGFEIW